MTEPFEDPDPYLTLARSIKDQLEGWETHVAVRHNGSKVEGAYYDEENYIYYDEEPYNEKFSGAYKPSYWYFYKVKNL